MIPISREFVHREYILKEKSIGDIAIDLGCSRAYIYKKIKQYGIFLRDKHDARILCLKKGKIKNLSYNPINPDFFKIWTSNMAYILGLIFTDGNLTPPSRISISQKETEILYKIADAMNLTYKTIFSGGKSCNKLQFSHEKIYQDLIEIGLTPNKSLTIKFPDIPDEFIKDFIRGCWDGDGSIYIETGRHVFNCSFCSGSFEFIDVMVNKIYYSCGFDGIKIYSHSAYYHKNTTYYIRMRKNKALNFLGFLYDDVENKKLFMERKYNIFKKYKENTC